MPISSGNRIVSRDIANVLSRNRIVRMRIANRSKRNRIVGTHIVHVLSRNRIVLDGDRSTGTRHVRVFKLRFRLSTF